MSARDRSWLGACVAAGAWAVHLGLSYFIAAQACPAPGSTALALSHTAARVAVTVTTVVAFAAAAASAFVSWAAWRTAADRGAEAAEGWTESDFIAMASVTLGTLLAVGILYGGLPLLFLDMCARTR